MATISLVAMLVAACGGGGGSSSGSGGSPSLPTTAVGSLISDATGGFLGSNLSGASPSSTASNASVYTDTYTPTSTVNTYSDSFALKSLTGTAWANGNLTISSYILSPTGWVPQPLNSTVVDSGDGSNILIQDPGAEPYTMSVTKTGLAGIAFAYNSNFTCLSVSGICTGTYPAGSLLYTLSFNSYFLMLTGNAPITDTAGTAMTVLPTLGATTFCDPNNQVVFKPISPLPNAGANNYNVYYTLDCSSSNILTAMSGPAIGTSLISLRTASNAVSTQYLLISNGSSFWIKSNTIYSLNSGNVWSGQLFPAGPNITYENRIAIDAELAVSGLTPL